MGLFKETRKKFKVRAPKFFGKNHRPKKRVGTCVDVNHSTAKDRECEISLAAPEIQVSLLSSTSTDDELCFNISAYDDAEVNSSVKQSKSSQSCSFSSSQTLSSFPTGSNEGKIDMILDSGPPTVVLNISAEDVDSSSLRSNLISASVSENSLISPQFQGAHGNVVLVSNNSSADHFKGGSATDVCEFLKTESSNCLSEASNILIEEAMEILEKHIRKEEEQKYYVEPVEECASSYSNNLARNDALPQLDCSGMNLFTDSCPSSDTLCESTIKNEPWDANEFTSNLDVDSFSDLIRFNRSSIHEASRSTEDTAVQDSKLPSSRISQTCANNVILEPTIQPHDPGKNEYNFFSGHLPNGVSLLPSTDLPHHLSSIEDNSSSLDAQYFATPWSQWDCTTQPFNGYDYRRDAADAAGPGWPVSDSWPHRADNESLHETASLQNHVRHLHLQKYYRDDKPLPYDSHTLPQQSYYSINHEFDSFAASSTERHYFDPYAFTYHGDRNPNQLVAPPLCGPSLPLDQHPHTPSLLLPHAHCRMDASDATVLSNNDGPKIDRRSLDGNSSAAGNSAGASPMGSPMPAGGASKTRMDRLCGVCGDRALGYNFNAITCESCKAFFRRNALKNKNLKCPFQDNCSVDTVTRRFCQKCRLRKCFEIGMKKEWIMTEEEKLKKKQKIEANKLRKQAGDSSMHPLCGSSEVSRSSPSNSPSFKTELSPSPASSTASMEHLGQAVDFHFSRRSSLEFEIPGSPEVLGKPYIHPQLNIQEKNPHVSSYVSTPGSTVLHSNETHSKPHAVVIGMVRGTESNSAGSNTGSIASKVMRLDNQSDVHHEGIDVVVSAQPPVSFTLRESALSLSHLGVCHPGVEMNPYPFSGTHGTSMHVSEPPVAPAIPVASVSPVPHMDGNSMNTATSFREALTVLSPEAARTHPQAFSDATQSPPQGNIPQTSPTPHFSFTSNESVPNMFSPTLGISQNDPRQHHRDFAPLDSFSLTASPTTTSEIRPLANHPLTTSVPHVTHTEPSSNASSDYKDFGSIAQNRQSASVNLLTGTSSLPDESVCAATDHASTSGSSYMGLSQLVQAVPKLDTRSAQSPCLEPLKNRKRGPPVSTNVSLSTSVTAGAVRAKQKPTTSAIEPTSHITNAGAQLHSNISSNRYSNPAILSILKKFETGCKQYGDSHSKSPLRCPVPVSSLVSPVPCTSSISSIPSSAFSSQPNCPLNSLSNLGISDFPSRRMGASASTSQALPSNSDNLPLASGHLRTSTENLPSDPEQLPTSSNVLPSVSKELPASSNELPSVSKELPASSNELPSVSKELPASSNKLPSVAEILPSVSRELPGSVVLPSASEELEVVSVCEESTSAFEKLESVTGNTRRTNKELLSVSKEIPSTVREYPSVSEDLMSSFEELPSASEKISSASEEIPSVSEKLPSASEDLMSSFEELPSASEEIPSASEDLMSSFEELPSASEEIPSVSEAIPSASEAIPSASEAIPSVSEAMPSASEESPCAPEEITTAVKNSPFVPDELPSVSVKLVSVTEELSALEELPPSLEDLQPTPEQLLSTSEEFRPSSVSLLAPNEGLPFTHQKLPLREMPFSFKVPNTVLDGPLVSRKKMSASDVPSTSIDASSASIDASCASNDASSASNDASSASNDAPSASNDTSSASNDAPSASNDASSASDDVPSASDDVPSASDDVPSASDDVPSASDDVPSAADDVPSAADDVPSAADDGPSIADDGPSASDDVPSASDDVPSASDDVPSASDDVPSASDDVPWASDDVPSTHRKTATEPTASSSSTSTTTPSLEDSMSFCVLEALKKIQDNDGSQNDDALPNGGGEASYRDSIVNSAVEAELSPYTLVLGSTRGQWPCTLSAAEQYKLDELQRADYAMLAPLSDDQDYRRDQVNPSLINVINMTDIAIRRLIQMSKQLSSFSNLCTEDQIALLKGSCTEMMILRSVTAYDADKEAWEIPEHHDTYKSIKLKVLKGAPGNVHVYEEHKRFILAFRPEWRHDQNIMLLLSAITLFTPTRPNVLHPKAIQHEQCCYLLLLKRYLETQLGVCASRAVYWDLLERINDLRRLNENHVKVYMQVNPEEVRPLLIEIFDLKQR